MPTPFPGMDPYLEQRGLWEEVHAGLIVGIQQFLNPLVRPRYRVAIKRRTYLAVLAPDVFVGKPDVLVVSPQGERFGSKLVGAAASGAPPLVGELPMPEEVVERYLEVRDPFTGEVITVIELLSPTNKLTREGREQYERKRLKILGTATHLVEVDLLRAGDPFPVYLPDDEHRSNYRIIVSRAQHRPRADVYLFGLRDPIPDIPIPLRPREAEPLLPLNQILHDLYDRASFDLAVDYRQSPLPPLSSDDAEWVRQLLQQQRTTTGDNGPLAGRDSAPARRALRPARHGAFGPGWRANATLSTASLTVVFYSR